MFSFRNLFLCLLALTVLTGFAAAQKTPQVDYRKKIADATPKALPQAPAAKKLKSDAADDNLKGKVKSLVEEREGLTGIEKPIGRRLSLIADFDAKGNFLKEVSFEYRGKPFQVTVYGYIDGARASVSEIIRDQLRLGKAVGEDETEIQEPNKPDPRYEYKYEYKYADGKLVEMQMFYNTGRKGMRYVYNYKGNQREKLAYDDRGKLNQKYLYTLDERGNDIEFIDFDVWQPEAVEKGKFRYKYESFDAKGNWTKRIFSKLEAENGKEVYKPIAIEYRKITYYP